MPSYLRQQTTTIPTLDQDSLDHDHDELLTLCLTLTAADERCISGLFSTLRAKFTDHFAIEDALMSPHDFSSRQCHLDEHAAVLESFEEVSQLLAAGDSATARRLASSLADWLPEHIDALDRHLVKFLFYRQTGGAAIQLHR